MILRHVLLAGPEITSLKEQAEPTSSSTTLRHPDFENFKFA